MDLVGHRRKRQQKSVATTTPKDIYQHDLQLYDLPPTDEIQLQEFEDLALGRLELLRILEQATQKGHKIFSNEWKESIFNDLNKQNLKRYARLAKSSGNENTTESDLQARRTDHISHFILRLAYCRSSELRSWFLSREIEWFKLRFTQLSAKGVEKFLALNRLTYSPISVEEKTTLHEELFQSTAGVYVIDAIDFYKVSYTEVAGLVKKRRVYLEKGFAYIPSFELVTCIIGIFRAQLNQALVHTNTHLPILDDERINILVSNLHNSYTGKNYAQRNDGGSLHPSNLDVYVRQHFPLCMRQIHESFRATHHMKHHCRLQYGLFLKAAGLTFEDAVAFWREEFTKRIEADKFEKQYTYYLKHQYGKVGSMFNYSGHNCIKIINNNPGPGEHHGCPFKHWDASALKSKLTEYGVSSEGVTEILDKASSGHYQIACSKYFEYTHGQPNLNPINHPNQYFEDSFALSNDADKSGATKKSNPTKDVGKPKDVDTNLTMEIDGMN